MKEPGDWESPLLQMDVPNSKVRPLTLTQKQRLEWW